MRKTIDSTKLLYVVDSLKWLSGWLNSFHIYAFTLVSGYLYFYLRYEKGKYQEPKGFLENKIKRPIVPYIFVCIIWVVPVTCLFFDYTAGDIFKKYILATAPSQLWFLWMLFDVFLIVYCCSDFIYNSNLISILISLIGIVAGTGAIGLKIFSNIFCIWTGCVYILCFILGFKIRQYGNILLNRIDAYTWLFCYTGAYILVAYLHSFNGVRFKIISFGFAIILHFIGAMMAFLVLQKLADYVDWKNNKLIKGFSQISMPIFLLHQQLIYFSISLFNGYVNPYVNAIINVMFAIVGSVIITKLLYKVRVFRFLMGEKQ